MFIIYQYVLFTYVSYRNLNNHTYIYILINNYVFYTYIYTYYKLLFLELLKDGMKGVFFS